MEKSSQVQDVSTQERTSRDENFLGERLENLVDKELGRRSFVKLVGLGVFAATAGGVMASVAHAIPEKKTKRQYGMVIDLVRCVNCKACTIACKLENKTPPGVMYNPVREEEIGEFPNVKRRWFPSPCYHCTNPPCVPVCPVKATWKRAEDGIVIVDYEKCEAKLACMEACPYGARYFDEGDNYPAQETEFGKIPSPEFHGQYGLRESGNAPINRVRKCTFCLHLQDAEGNYTRPTACSETCMGRAIHFGDLGKASDGACITHKGCNLKTLLASRHWIRLKEELKTEPNVYYLT